MSRGFVKEGDQEEIPMIPPRAPLPHGETNYVTPAGWQELLAEKQALEEERTQIHGENETEKRIARMVIDQKMSLLEERIASARVIDPAEQPADEVRFGAVVTFKNGTQTVKFQIVGVDEANVKKNKIAFTSPIAKALIGHKKGSVVNFTLGRETRKLHILEVEYLL